MPDMIYDPTPAPGTHGETAGRTSDDGYIMQLAGLADTDMEKRYRYSKIFTKLYLGLTGMSAALSTEMLSNLYNSFDAFQKDGIDAAEKLSLGFGAFFAAGFTALAFSSIYLVRGTMRCRRLEKGELYRRGIEV